MSTATPKPKAVRASSTHERRPLHVRLSSQERCELNRIAARLGLSPSATIRFLIHAEDQRGTSEVSLALLWRYPAFWRDD